MERNALKSLIREELVKALGGRQGSPPIPVSPAPRTPAAMATGKAVINREAVMAAREQGVLEVPANAIVTPLARETAEQFHLRIVVAGAAAPASEAAAGGDPRKHGVAVASDHGGFAMKEVIVKHVQGLGYPVQDLGPANADPVDYPDFARAVAEAVAAGRVARGIMIDGVGVGSTMAANKVPGVRAAMCTDLFEANNSREHNDANVLCLGGRTLGEELAKAMVAKWLETPFGGGRHQKRVDKIMAIERDYLVRRSN